MLKLKRLAAIALTTAALAGGTLVTAGGAQASTIQHDSTYLGGACRARVPSVGPLGLDIVPCINNYNDHMSGRVYAFYHNTNTLAGVSVMVGLNHCNSFYRVETDSWSNGGEDPFSNVAGGNQYNISGGYYYNGIEYGDIQSPCMTH